MIKKSILPFVVLVVLCYSHGGYAYRLIQQTGGAGTYTFGNLVAAGSGETMRWSPRTIQFQVNNNGAGDGLTFNQTQTAVTLAYGAWRNLSCVGIRFSRQAGTNATRNATDGQNVTYWAEAGAAEYTNGTLGFGTLAVTILTIRGDQTLTDVDIAFNGRDFLWALTDAPGPPTTVDVQDTATHEIGHMIGLHHSEIVGAPTPTMNRFNQAGNAGRSLEADDINAACYVYPSLAGGSSTVAGDFNGDGRDDLAIGVPNESVGTTLNAGAVNVLYGSASGLTSTSDQMWHQDVNGIIGATEADDYFGWSLAAGDFNGDGWDDLAVGVRNESIGNIAGAGAVNVIYGSSLGLTASGDQMWHQNVAGIIGGAEAGDQFGSALAAGDINNDGYADLAIGVPNESVGTTAGAGAVNILFGSNSGLTANNDQMFHQNVPGIAGGAEANDHFGASLVLLDFGADNFADLAVAVPNESIGNIQGAGAVNVMHGGAFGLMSAGDQMWHQDTNGIRGGAETDDGFGSSLTAADYDNNGFNDLAIGVPYESIGNRDSAGAVNVIYSEFDGLRSNGNQIWHQNSRGIAGGSETNDGFGSAVSSGDYNNDGRYDLSVGVPAESIGSIRAAGAVNVIYGSGSGLDDAANQLWHQDRTGIVGVSEADDRFGSVLVSGQFRGPGPFCLAIGVPNESVGNTFGAGAVNVLCGSVTGLNANNDQMWHQNAANIAGVSEANDGFGSAH